MINHYKSWLSNTLINHTLTLTTSAFLKKVLYVFALFFLTATSWGQTITIGSGTNLGNRYPVAPYYGFTYSQQIVLKTDVNTSGLITKLRFYSNGTALTNSNNWTVYLGHTSKTAFSSNTDWITSSAMTQVFSGIVPTPSTTAGWYEIDINDVFVYNNIDNLVVAVDENAASYTGSTSTNYFRIWTTPVTNRGIYVTSDSSNPDPTAISSTTGTRTSYIAQIQLELAPAPTCYSPMSLSVASITNNSAQMSWTAPSSAPSSGYEVYYSTTNTAPTAGTTATATVPSGTSYSFSGLNGNTTYYTWIRSNCGSGDISAWVASSSFTTLCNPVSSLPWTEGFEGLSSVSTTTFPSCWLEGTGTNWNSLSTVTSSYNDPRTGSYYIGCTYGGSNDRIWTPGFQLTAGVSYDFSTFFVGDGYSGWTGDIVYNTSASATGETVIGSSFISSSTTSTSGTNYSRVRRTFVPSTSGVYFFGIRITSSNSPYSYLAFDDITLEVSPTCYEPTALTSSTISYQTATIGWTAPASGTSPAGYEYEVRTSGAAGSGVTGLFTSGSTTAPTVSASLTGLTGATTYSYYIRSDCGGGDYSAWSNAGTFTTTSCNVPTAVTSSAITTSTATIAWTAPATGSPIGYEYEVRTSGVAGSGATGLIASGTTTAPAVSASLNALTAATSYSVYVRTNCYSGFNSSWTSAVTFATLCNSVTTLPFTESFEGITSGTPICWGIAGTLASSSSYHFSSTASGKTGRGLIFNSYNSSVGSTSELITPTLDLSTLTTAEMKFWFKNPTGGNFEVLISTDNGANYTSLQSSLTAQTAWLQKTYTITSYISSTVKIKFKGTSNYGSGDAYVYLDEIIVQAIPTCFPVTALTSSAITYQTATIGWTAPTSGTSPAGYEYEVRTSGAAGSGATGLVTSGSTTSPTVSANLTGLNGGTAYTYYVRSNCGGGDYSSWTSGTFASTSCNVPTAVTSSSITTTTSTISWTAASGSPSGYEYEVRTSGAAGSGATGLVTSGSTTAPTISANLTGLAASTSYSVYVRTNCYSGFNSSWSSATTLTTLCNPISTFPYSENFDGVTTPALPNCWSVLDVNTDGDKWITYTGYSQSGNNSVGLYTDFNAGANNDFLISPQFNLSGIKRLKYSVRARSSSEPNDYRVLLSTTGSSASDFSTVLLPLTSVSSTSYTQVIIDLSMYSGNIFIAFNVPSGGLDGYYIYIDDVIIEDTPNTWTGTTSNSWNTASNWSLNTVPTASDDILISSNGSNPPVMDVDVTIPAGKSLTLTGGRLSIAPGKILTIAGTANFGGRSVTFESNATETAMLGPLTTGTLTGATNVTVERFIPARRAYRFLSPAVTTSTTIRQNWQEDGVNTAGFGTHITGATGATAGFDPTETNNPSLLRFTSGAWVGATNTNVTTLTAGNAYCLMVRGDRTTDLTTNLPATSNTVLRAKGTLFTGNFSPALSAAASGYSFIGNPYQAPLDIKTALQSSTDVNKNVVYYWDPTINARGGYITRNLQTSQNNITSSVNDYVQPGQAFFVVNEPTLTSTPALTFTENHKSVVNAAAGVFRNANTNEYGTLRVNLQANTNNQWQTIEGALAIFNDNFSWNVTSEDATKLANLDEDVSFVQNNTSLAIALQSNPIATSELPIKIDKMRHTNYKWQFELDNYDGATPYLFDTLNNSYTQINNGTVVPFTADANTTNRFKIVFQNAVLSNATFQNTLAIYPNPAKAGASFYIEGVSEATVTVSNLLGQTVPVQTKSQGTTLQVTPNTSLSQGVYLVNITSEGNTQQVKWIVE